MPELEKDQQQFAEWRAPEAAAEQPAEINSEDESNLERNLRDYFSRIDEDDKLAVFISRLKKSLDDKTVQELGLGQSLNEITNSLEACKDIKDEQVFIKTVAGIIRPMYQARIDHPEKFATFDRITFVENGKFTPLNEIFSYGVHGNEIQIHLASAYDLKLGQKLGLLKDGLRELAKVVAANPEIEIVTGTSWIVASNPGLMERLGFKVEGEIPEDIRAEHFPYETRPVSKAVITKEELLHRYRSL